jgi:hypothetical protein
MSQQLQTVENLASSPPSRFGLRRRGAAREPFEVNWWLTALMVVCSLTVSGSALLHRRHVAEDTGAAGRLGIRPADRPPLAELLGRLDTDEFPRAALNMPSSR